MKERRTHSNELGVTTELKQSSHNNSAGACSDDERGADQLPGPRCAPHAEGAPVAPRHDRDS